MTTCNVPTARHRRGFSLLEVLIALIVFSIGLLGVAAMLVSAVRGNHQAYHHSQAVYVATAMADGMRANLAAVNAGAYNIGWTGTSAGNSCTSCDSTSLAARDLAAWAQMASQRLPGGQIQVACNAIASSSFTPAAYNGTCTLGVRWSEVGDTGQSQASSDRAFTWIIQP